MIIISTMSLGFINKYETLSFFISKHYEQLIISFIKFKLKLNIKEIRNDRNLEYLKGVWPTEKLMLDL